jgi:hypothetical protein
LAASTPSMASQAGGAPAPPPSPPPAPPTPAPPTPPPRGPRNPYRPTFQPADEDIPTRPELVTFTNAVKTYFGNIKFLLQYLGVDEATLPQDPPTTIHVALSRPVTIWKRVAEIENALSQFEQLLAQTQVAAARAETAMARATSSAPPRQLVTA